MAIQLIQYSYYIGVLWSSATVYDRCFFMVHRCTANFRMHIFLFNAIKPVLLIKLKYIHELKFVRLHFEIRLNKMAPTTISNAQIDLNDVVKANPS